MAGSCVGDETGAGDVAEDRVLVTARAERVPIAQIRSVDAAIRSRTRGRVGPDQPRSVLFRPRAGGALRLSPTRVSMSFVGRSFRGGATHELVHEDAVDGVFEERDSLPHLGHTGLVGESWRGC